MLVSTVAWFFCDVPPLPKNISPLDILKNDGSVISQAAMMEMAGIQYLALLIWHLVEGILLHVWGTTPGKALTTLPNLQIERLSEEHATVRIIDGGSPLEPGDLVRILPNHACVVSNLVDQAWLVGEDGVCALPIAARGKIA